MAIQGVLQLTGTLTGAPEGYQNFLVSLTLSNAIYSRQVNLSAIPTNYTVPVGASLFLLFLPAGNTQTVTLKGSNAGDTGIGILKTAPFLALPVDQTVSTLVRIEAGGLVTGAVVMFL